MNRTDRLLAIVLKLRTRSRVRAEDLAEMFETSTRTIYRDMQALNEMGVPILSTPGQGYALVGGYFLPPVSLTTEEAAMLLLGGELVAQTFDHEYRVAAQSALLKIEAVLLPGVLHRVERVRHAISLIAPAGADAPWLPEVRRAVVDCKTLRFRYHARQTGDGDDAPSEREADPYGLVHSAGTWYLVAYCHWRQGIRNFRLDRIDNLSVLDTTFTRPPDLTLERGDPYRGRDTVVRVRFDPAVVRWVKEAPSFYTVEQQDGSDGLLVTLTVRQERDVLPWLLSWGRHVHVLEPETLRAQLVEEAVTMARRHETPR